MGDYAAHAGRIRRIGLILVALAVLAPPIAQWMPVSASRGLLVLELTDLGTKALLATFSLRALSARLSWFRPLTALIAALAFSQWIAAHRHGNLARPYALMDMWIEWGYSPTDLLWLVGAAITILIAGLLKPTHRATHRWPTALAIAAMLIVALFIVRWAPQLPFSPPLPPPPPRSQAPEPPPPPPQPTPIALVQLEDAYRPTQRLGGYYLRTHAASRISQLKIDEGPADIWVPDVEANGPSNVLMAATSGMVRARILMLDATNRVPVLLNGQYLRTSPPPPPPFRRGYYSQSIVPGSLIAPDLDLATFRQTLVATQWTPDQLAHYTQSPSDTNILALARELVDGIPEPLSGYLPPRVKVIRHWLNHRCAYSAKAGTEAADAPITSFLFETRTGGSRQFATAAVLLFRSAGVPARLGIGYVVPVSPSEARTEFVIADTHAQEWPEVYLNGTGWVPVPLNPTNVLDRPQPAPDPELQAMLQDVADKAEAPTPSRWISVQWQLWAVTTTTVALLGLLLYRVHTRYLAVLVASPSRRHHRALQAALSLSAAAGWRRIAGETYLDLCDRIGTEESATGKPVSTLLRDVATRYRACYETGRTEPISTWLSLLVRMDFALWRHYAPERLLPFLRPSFRQMRHKRMRQDEGGPDERR